MKTTDDLNDQEKMEQENVFLKAKLMMQNGLYQEFADMDLAIENQFLKNIMMFENVEQKPVSEIINVKPGDFPPSCDLTKSQLDDKFELLAGIMKNNGFSIDLAEKLPLNIAYDYLIKKYLNGLTDVLPSGWVTHIDGCSGDCPSCFQVDYCESVHETWTPDELAAEQKKREEEEGNMRES